MNLPTNDEGDHIFDFILLLYHYGYSLYAIIII